MKRTFGRKALVFFISLCMVLQFSLTAPLMTAFAADDITLQIQKTVNLTNVAPGQNFVYTLKYANPSVTTDARNVVITDVLPPELDYVGLDTSIHIQNAAYDADTRTVTFTFIDPLPAGVTGILKISAKFKDGVTLDGTTATNYATIDGDNSPAVESNHVTVTAHVKPEDWNVSKTKTFPSGSVVPVLDSNVTYRVRVTGNSSGGLNLHNIIVTDTLPTGAQYVSSSPAGTYDPDTNKVTWDEIANLNVGATADRFVTVRYSSTDFDVSDTVTNHADVTAQLYGDTTDIPKDAEYTHGFSTPAPQASASFSKSNRQNDDEYSIGQTAIFYINNAANTGNVPLDLFAVEDDVPHDITLTSITTGRYNDEVPLQISYKTDPMDTEWTPWGSPLTTGNTNTTLYVADLGLTPGDTITNLKWDFGDGTTHVPVGFAPYQSMEIRGTVLDPSPDPLPHTVTNYAYLHWSYGGSEHVINASAHFDIINAIPWLNPSKSADAATYYYGTRVTYTLRVKNHDYATGNLTNPIAIEALPVQLEDPQFISVTGSSGLPAPTGTNFTPGAMTSTKTDSAGRPVYVWRIGSTMDPVTLEPGQYYDIKFSARIKDQTLVGSVRNTYYLTTDITNNIKPYTGRTTDTEDLDGDGHTDDIMVPATRDIFVKFQGSLESQKWVKGELDSAWHHYTLASPGLGETVAGGKADYRLTVRNSGSNGPISNIVLIDKLPRIGDTGVVDPTARESQWRPYLVNEITCVAGAGLLDDYKIYYSTNANPSCTELADPANNNGSGGDGWTETPPADITTVRSIKIDLGDTVLQPNDSVTFEWPMRAPYGTTPGLVAWNSFGYGATYEDYADEAEIDQPFLPSEPQKVGFEIHNEEPLNLGNRVWEDKNRNGIQDTGEPGINGVLIKLFNGGADPDTDEPLAYTRTGDHFDEAGQGAGWYLFPDLPSGNYFMTFTYPDSYRATVYRTGGGSNDAADSDLDTGASHAGSFYTGETRTITLSSDNMDMDAGLYIPASIGDRVWNDQDADGIQDGGEPNIQGVTVSLADASGDPVTDADGNPVTDKTTNSSGIYTFDNLAPGDYKVHFTLPANYAMSPQDAGGNDGTDSDADATGWTITTTLQSGEDDISWDCGMHKGRVGDRVWNDNSNNGIQDNGEANIPGATVVLHGVGPDTTPYTGDDTTVGTTTTNSSGNYLFTELDAGDYYITVTATLPLEYRFALQDQGADDTKDSDTDATGVSAVFTQDAGEWDMTRDAGMYRLPRLGDRVWKDINANGIQDGGETGVANVTVTCYNAGADNTALTGDDTLVGTKQTNASGIYTFTSLELGRYYLLFTLPANYVFSPADATADTTDSDADTSTGYTAVTSYLGPNANDTSWDAGIHKGIIGDFVWHDGNGNGIQDTGETGVNNIPVALYLNGNPTPLRTTNTNASGSYQFTDLDAGNYSVKMTLGAGYDTFTSADAGGDDAKDSDVDATGASATFTQDAGEIDLTRDAGMYKQPSIGNFVWNDMDADGVQDTGETGVSGVTVTLYNVGEDGTPHTGDDTTAGTATTNASGAYLFDHLTPGSYYIGFTLPTGYAFSPANATADTTDSDADTSTGYTAATSLAYDEYDDTWDAGIHKAALGDYVWYDINANGIQDTGEAGINGVTVELHAAPGGGLIASTTTATGGPSSATGYYEFLDLPAGQYTITVIKPSGDDLFTLRNAGDDAKDSDVNSSGVTGTITLAAGQRDWTNDAGIYMMASYGDFVWNDLNADGIQDTGEGGIPGVAVTLYSAGPDGTALTGDDTTAGTDTTDAGGYYSFDHLMAGTYYAKFTLPAGYAFSTQDAGGNDARDSDANTSTGYTANTTLSPEETELTWDAGMHRAALGDYIWHDANGNGIQDAGETGINDVTVELRAAGDDSLVASTTTITGGPSSTAGYYAFIDVDAGQYFISVSKPAGYDAFTARDAGSDNAKDSDVNSSGRTGTITLAAGQRDWTWDAGVYHYASLGDFVWHDDNLDGLQDADEAGVPNITVRLYSETVSYGAHKLGASSPLATTTTDTDGKYLFPNLAPGNYSVHFALPVNGAYTTLQDAGTNDATDSDANTSTGKTAAFALASGQNDLTRDAGIYYYASLGDTVWDDFNINGIQDAGEAGIPGVTVKLLSSAGVQLRTATTDAGGHYSFTQLTPGDYSVQVTKPAAYAGFTPKDAGSDDALDSDMDTTTGKSVLTSLATGQSDMTWDAGLYKLAALGSRIWIDTDKDGIQDKKEKGVKGVTVLLYDSEGNLVGTTVTDAKGDYMFTGLMPGDYRVKFILPPGYVFTITGTDPASGTDSNADVNGDTTPVDLVSGDNNVTIDAGVYKGSGGATADPSYDYIVIGSILLIFAGLLIALTLHRMRRTRKTETDS